MSIIVCDTETTGLLKAKGNLLSTQPHIIEIFCLKIDKNFKKIGEFHTLIKPPIPIPEIITKITGLTDNDVRGKPTFVEVYPKLIKFFFSCHTFVAHNASFDVGVLAYELKRIKKEFKFPWPPFHYCTVEQSMHIKGHRLKLQELHKIATGVDEINGAHRAVNDVNALFECYKYLKGKGHVG